MTNKEIELQRELEKLKRELKEAKATIKDYSDKAIESEKEKALLRDELLKAQAEIAKLTKRLEKQIDTIGKKNEIIKRNNYNEFFSKDEKTAKLLKKSRSVKTIEKGNVGRKPGSKNYINLIDLRADEEIVLNPEEFILAIDKDGFKKIGEDIAYKIKRVPAKYELIKIIRPKYLKDNGQIIQSLSSFCFGNSVITSSFVSNALYLKYVLNIPVNKISKHIKAEMGISISKQDWCHYFDKASEMLEPIYKGIKSELINNDAEIIQADETTISVSKSDGENQKHYMFVATSSYYSHPVMYYEYMGPRIIKDNIDLFDNYNGHIVCDSFNGYDNISKDKDIKLARCWVHARRYVTDSIKGYKKATLPQVELLNKINELFDIEDKLDEENADLNKIKEARNKLSVTVLNEIKVICKKNIKTKISLFKKAVKYILNHFADLSTFLEDPKIPIHNNKTERAVGLFVTCRKNFQTVCSDESANRNAKLFTIIQTAQANGLNAEKYLEYVLVSLFEKKDPNSLLPWNGSIPDYIKEPF